MKRLKLEVEKRKILGKKVKTLRKEGILPANIYGKDIKSTAVQLPVKKFEEVFKQAGETSLIDVALDGQARPVLIHNVFQNPMTSAYLHADFYQVNLKEKIKSMIPVEIVEEPKAVSEKIGLLLQTLNEIEVEALPEDLPENFEINVENLANVDDQITVGDLKAPQGVEILSDKEQVVVKITELVSKQAEEQAKAEAEAAEAAKAEGAAEAGEAPIEEGAEGEAKAEEKKEEAPEVNTQN